MSRQNILKFYGSKLDLKLDTSETYDFIIDSTEWVDLVLDYSEEYDFQLDNTNDFGITSIESSVVNSNLEYDCQMTIMNQLGFTLNTQNGECIQYQH